MDTSELQERLEQHSFRPRKIHLDSGLYRPHSVRECSGDVDCDHDFDLEPTVEKQTLAIWKCTLCGRAFEFEVWEQTATAVEAVPDEELELQMEFER